MTAAERILFFYPSNSSGGAEILYSRLADKLARDGFNVGVIDYEGGGVASLIKNEAVDIIIFNHDSQVIEDLRTCIICPPSIYPYLKYILGNFETMYVLFWFIHPYNLLATMPRFSFLSVLELRYLLNLYKLVFPFRFRIKRLLLLIAENNNGLYFMDNSSRRENEKIFDLALKKSLIPIPVSDLPEYEEYNSVLFKPQLTCGWVGRLADHKYKSLIYLLRELENRCADDKTVLAFKIIGDGEYIEDVRTFADQLEYVRVEYVGSIKNNKLAFYIRSNIDILFAMGTSALEGAAAGVPTVLIDATFTKFPNGYLFRWLYETSDFDLASVIGEDSEIIGTKTISEILKEAAVNRQEVSRKSYKYVAENHALELSAEILLNAVKRNRLRIKDIYKYL
ncbi:glycosyltransferase [Deinococcus radiopugnans]|uniref:glycosyltransferase n=1 Tax=Deinococcus radiopugnans TaxID=57497 RepID=UPI0009DF73E7|nr:glycosyltransferase [Deinococcus radiopugnans]